VPLLDYVRAAINDTMHKFAYEALRSHGAQLEVDGGIAVVFGAGETPGGEGYP